MMKTSSLAACLACLITNLNAGENPLTPIEDTPKQSWLTPTLDLRLRYEFGSQSGLRDAHAMTARARPGLRLSPIDSLHFLGELEGTWAPIDSYSSPQGTHPGPQSPGRTTIADPENLEVNQLRADYNSKTIDLTMGRQRIILDDAAFVGNVGWRQNEQTFDAASTILRPTDEFTFRYSYINQVNRISGRDAIDATRKLEGDVHLLNLRFEPDDHWNFALFGYFMDFNRLGNQFSNNTFGASANGTLPLSDNTNLLLLITAAHQTDANSSPRNFNTWYIHTRTGIESHSHSLHAGLERLSANNGTSFITPLATAHAFNGWSDAMANARIAGTPMGIGDIYLRSSHPLPWKLQLSNAIHYLANDNINTHYGWEFNSSISKRFNNNHLAIAKFAHFDANQSGPFPNNVTRFTIEWNYSF